MKKIAFFITLLFANISFAYDYQVSKDNLLEIIESGNKDFLIRVLKEGNAELNLQDDLGITPLIKAAYNNNAEIFEILLSAGADINKTDIGGIAPIHIAARDGHMAILDLCIKYSISKDLRDILGWTPLMHAAVNGNLDVVKLLIQEGADVAMVDINGNTALVHAVMSNSLDTVNAILSAEKFLDEAQIEKALNYGRNKKIIALLEDKKIKILQAQQYPDHDDEHPADGKLMTEVTSELEEVAGEWNYMVYLGSFKTEAKAQKYWQKIVSSVFPKKNDDSYVLPAIISSHEDSNRLYIGFFSQRKFAQKLSNILIAEDRPCKIKKFSKI